MLFSNHLSCFWNKFRIARLYRHWHSPDTRTRRQQASFWAGWSSRCREQWGSTGFPAIRIVCLFWKNQPRWHSSTLRRDYGFRHLQLRMTISIYRRLRHCRWLPRWWRFCRLWQADRLLRIPACGQKSDRYLPFHRWNMPCPSRQ